VVIGSSRLAWPHYLALNITASLLWAACWLAVGYAVGAAAEQAVGNLAKIERELFLTVLLVAVAIGIALKLRARAARSQP
jgi:membrane protein DedA with SNARE-associated domain